MAGRGPWARAGDLAAELAAAGVRATADPRNLNPPAALVRVDAVEASPTGCGADLTLRVDLIVPGPWNADAGHALDALLADVLPALDAAGVAFTSATPSTYPLGDGAAAYTLALDPGVIAWP